MTLWVALILHSGNRALVYGPYNTSEAATAKALQARDTLRLGGIECCWDVLNLIEEPREELNINNLHIDNGQVQGLRVSPGK